MPHDSDDPELDKLLAELEKEGEESKPIIDKQIQKAKDEKKYDEYIDTTEKDYDGEIPEEAFFD